MIVFTEDSAMILGMFGFAALSVLLIFVLIFTLVYLIVKGKI